MLEDYLSASDLSQNQNSKPKPPSPTRRTSKPRPANLPVQTVATIQEKFETIDLTASSNVSRKPPVPPRPAPRKRVKGILKNRHEDVQQPPIEATVEGIFNRNHNSASMRDRRRVPHRPKVSGYQSEMDPKKCCSKRLRRTRSTDLVR